MYYNYMENNIKKLLRESLLDEDYPTSFNIDEFKKLTSFNSRIQYCESNLERISSGSSRIVYKIDDTKVLKLAKNKKGLAQNEAEISQANEIYTDTITTKIFDSDDNNLWVEMELARKLTPQKFKEITGYRWVDFVVVMNFDYIRITKPGMPTLRGVSQELYQQMWDDEDNFPHEMLGFLANYSHPVGDLVRLSSYGIVNRDGEDIIVMIDFGFTQEVQKTYYR